MASVLNVIWNCRVTISCGKVVPPEVVAGGLRNPIIYSNLLQQTTSVGSVLSSGYLGFQQWSPQDKSFNLQALQKQKK